MKTNTERNWTGSIRIAAMLAGCICASTATAQQQQQSLDTENLRPSQVHASSCAEVNWAPQLLADYPRVAEGCQEVITSKGSKWARFEAELVRKNRDGSVTVDFKDRNGRSIENLTLMPPADQRVLIDGRQYRVSELRRGQELNVYVPEGIFAVALEPDSPSEQLARIVNEPIVVAQAEPEPRLPDTAGSLPLFLIAGLASLLGGVGLRLGRKFFARRRVLPATER